MSRRNILKHPGERPGERPEIGRSPGERPETARHDGCLKLEKTDTRDKQTQQETKK